jgi:hypothetical protein
MPHTLLNEVEVRHLIRLMSTQVDENTIVDRLRYRVTDSWAREWRSIVVAEVRLFFCEE